MTDFFKIINTKFSDAKIKIQLEINNEIVSTGEANVATLASGSDYGINLFEELHKAICLEYLQHMNIIDEFGELIPPAPNEPNIFFDK